MSSRPVIHKLTELGYSADTRGELKLYVYRGDRHTGGIWFGRGRAIDRDNITIGAARLVVASAIRRLQEVRICNGQDWLVFHAVDGEILFPPDPEKFWETCCDVELGR